MPDQHFLVSLKDRLRLPVCPPGATCQHRRQDGTLCGEPLDSRGKHAIKCEVGPTREARHDGLRDFTAAFHPKVSGYVAVTEQRVTAWDRGNPATVFSRRHAWTLPPGMPPAAAKSLSTLARPTLTAATSRVSGHAPAGMELLLWTPCGGRGAATHLLGASWCHLSSKPGAAPLRRQWRSFAPGGWRWTRPSAKIIRYA